ncbi:hypothetical protein OGAPHI_002582 [Ogataea philodendri]|uniref:Uncharacterized protein n=1 Tax=Ogataea philodendri TaxID=1378263 RepID=A0A9P8PBJ6_9ASCO|nr:uncharacterized protein OGAPHI_002582 [Ogataea philodendri]KAH3668827.1 hypothetical protein OGAPHI_002582 [Ogataea philodendri]
MQAADPTQYNTGEVSVRTSSGQVRVRKGQTDEEFAAESDRFRKEGPVISEFDTFTNAQFQDVNLCAIDNVTQSQITHRLERRYFLGSFQECLDETTRLLDKLEPTCEGKQESKKYNKLLKYLTGFQEKCIERLARGLTVNDNK